MLVYYIIGLLFAIVMAKAKRRGRKFRKYLRGEIDEAQSLGTLAAKTVIGEAFDETVNEKTFVSSMSGFWSMDQFTSGTDKGPILVGVAHSDYSDTEIEEWIESTGSWNEGDLVQSREVGKRWIKKVGEFPTAEDASKVVVLNDGKPIFTKLGWMLLQGQGLKQWAYNQGTAALATTDPTVRLSGHANLWPR